MLAKSDRRHSILQSSSFIKDAFLRERISRSVIAVISVISVITVISLITLTRTIVVITPITARSYMIHHLVMLTLFDLAVP